MGIVLHRNEANQVVAIFPKDDVRADSLFELELLLGDKVDGISSTEKDFLLFFSTERLIGEVYVAIDALEDPFIRISFSTTLVPYWAPIPIIN